MAASAPSVIERMKATIAERELCAPDAPVLLMVSGCSDSTALAYAARSLHDAGQVGELAMLHVNHCLRGEEAEADARFAAQLAEQRRHACRMVRHFLDGSASSTSRPNSKSGSVARVSSSVPQ